MMAWKTVIPDRSICSYHNDILDNARKLQNMRERDYEEIKNVLSEVSSLAYDIEQWAENALVCGEKMEGRMAEYREAIESLGFKRIEKTSKK
jgi:hypothetical protein